MRATGPQGDLGGVGLSARGVVDVGVPRHQSLGRVGGVVTGDSVVPVGQVTQRVHRRVGATTDNVVGVGGEGRVGLGGGREGERHRDEGRGGHARKKPAYRH